MPVLIGAYASKKRHDKREKYNNDSDQEVRDAAALFKLKTIEGDRTVDLASVIKDKPVVLFFGSYT